MNPKVDAYVKRSVLWPQEIERLRPLLLSCGLTEEIKWGKPCYSIEGKNILILQEMKGFLAMMFFRGNLLSDPHKVLELQGPNSTSGYRMRFTSVAEIDKRAKIIKAYVKEAIDVADLAVEPAPKSALVLVDELRERFERDAALRAAFQALSPGRQREYNLHFAGAKQASTRIARIDKYASQILAGKGMRD